MKTCFKCGATKPLDAFYKHKAMADGHLGKCKECTKADVRMHERLAAAGQTKPREMLPADERAKRRAKRVADYKKRNREKTNARTALQYAVRTGKIVPWPVCCVPTCEDKPEAHHYDYSRPLDVIWLCRAHHHQTHALVPGFNSGKNKEHT